MGEAGMATGRFEDGGAAEGALEAEDPPFMRSAGRRLTLLTVFAAGPTGGAFWLPTFTCRASGLPVFSTGAVALAGTA